MKNHLRERIKIRILRAADRRSVEISRGDLCTWCSSPRPRSRTPFQVRAALPRGECAGRLPGFAPECVPSNEENTLAAAHWITKPGGNPSFYRVVGTAFTGYQLPICLTATGTDFVAQSMTMPVVTLIDPEISLPVKWCSCPPLWLLPQRKSGWLESL